MPRRPDLEVLMRHLRRPLAGWLDRVFENDFDQLELHRQFVAKHIETTCAKFEADFEGTLARLEGEEKDEYIDFMVEELQLHAESFPMFQWHAQFLIVYGTFEASLNNLCNVASARLKSSISFKDMAGQGVERAKLYLTKVVEVKNATLEDGWEHAALLGKIRNKIAHAQGRVDGKNDAAFVRTLRTLNGVTLRPVVKDGSDFNVILSSEFVSDAIGSLRSLVHGIARFERDWPNSPQ